MLADSRPAFARQRRKRKCIAVGSRPIFARPGSKLALTQAFKVLVIHENHNAGEHSLDLLKWGLIPYWCADPKGGRKPINAKSETVAKLPMFRDSYRRRRFILPIDAFYAASSPTRSR